MCRFVKKLKSRKWILFILICLVPVIVGNVVVEPTWGETARLPCLRDNGTTFDTASGHAEWTRNNSSVVVMFRGNRVYGSGIPRDRYNMSEDYSLVFPSIDYSYQGNYKCTYSSLKPNTPYTHTGFTVKVKERPIYIDGCFAVSCEQPITGVVTRNITVSKAGAKVRPTIHCQHTDGIRDLANSTDLITKNTDGSYTASITYQVEVQDKMTSNFSCWIVNDNDRPIETTSMTFKSTSIQHTGTSRTVGLSVGLTVGIVLASGVVGAILYAKRKKVVTNCSKV